MTLGAGRCAARPGSLAGMPRGPGRVTFLPTRNCITAGSGGAGVETGSAGTLLTRFSALPARPVKSTMTSARSAGPSTSCPIRTGRSHICPSAAICHTGARPKSRLMIRALAPLRMRNRYSRGSTPRYGHTLPLTSITSPKYSPIQVTPGMSLTG